MISIKWLENKEACSEGLEWFKANRTKCRTNAEVLQLLIKENHFDWANWVLTRSFSKKQLIQYVVYATELVLDIFEAQFSDDPRPTQAIDAAKAVLNSKKNREAAEEAAAYAAARAADAARATYGTDAEKEIILKMIQYGIQLLKGD